MRTYRRRRHAGVKTFKKICSNSPQIYTGSQFQRFTPYQPVDRPKFTGNPFVILIRFEVPQGRRYSQIEGIRKDFLRFHLRESNDFPAPISEQKHEGHR